MTCKRKQKTQHSIKAHDRILNAFQDLLLIFVNIIDGVWYALEKESNIHKDVTGKYLLLLAFTECDTAGRVALTSQSIWIKSFRVHGSPGSHSDFSSLDFTKVHWHKENLELQNLDKFLMSSRQH